MANREMKIILKRALIFLAAFFIIAILHYFKIITPVESLLKNTFSPFLSNFYSWSGKLNSSVSSDQLVGEDLKAAYEKAVEEKTRLLADNARLKALEEENKVLREHLNFAEDKKIRHVMANIIYRDKSTEGGQWVTINKGAKQGLKTGLLALDERGIVVGKLSEVQDDMSRLELASGKDFRAAVSLNENADTAGVVEGDLGLSAKIKFIPLTQAINKGDIVITSGLEESIPRGLVIGTIQDVERKDNEVWQEAVVNLLSDSNRTTIVSVVL